MRKGARTSRERGTQPLRERGLTVACTLAVVITLVAVCHVSGEGEIASEAASNPVEVYRSDLDERVEIKVWSSTETSLAPEGGRRFLGQQGNHGKLYMTVDELPEHSLLRLRFDLLLLGSADGNRTEFGPDSWSVMVDGGATLFSTTFANSDCWSGSR